MDRIIDRSVIVYLVGIILFAFVIILTATICGVCYEQGGPPEWFRTMLYCWMAVTSPSAILLIHALVTERRNRRYAEEEFARQYTVVLCDEDNGDHQQPEDTDNPYQSPRYQ